MKDFERFLGLSSLECFEALLVHWRWFSLVLVGGVWLISLQVIVVIIYLGNWTLVALVIASRFLMDFHLFSLEVIDVSNLGPFLSKHI
jgi:hypothetical protein